MKGNYIRAGLDVAASLVMGAAAVALLWRLVAGGPSGPPIPSSPVEELEAAGLFTSLTPLTRGSDRSPIVLIEFGDFECPFCARFARETFEQIDREFVFTGKVRYSFRHLPMPNHPFAMPAAIAADCAARQGRFWEMREYLYANQREFGNAIWFSRNGNVGADVAQLEACVRDSDRSRINADLGEAARLGVRSTPTFLVTRPDRNGRLQILTRINGAQPYSVFEDALNRVINDAS